MEQGLAVERKPAGVVGHHALALSLPNGLTQICFGMQAEVTFTTLRCIKGNDVIPGFDARYATTNLYHHARTLMTENRRKGALRIIA